MPAIHRVATHQKVKKFPDFSVTFHWPLNSFHWPLKTKQCNVYISFSFFCKPSILLSSVSISFRFLWDFERKVFDFTYKSILFFFLRRALTTTTTTCVRRRVSNWSVSLLCNIHLIFYPVLKNRAENLLAINRNTEFPDWSLTLPISKISLTS